MSDFEISDDDLDTATREVVEAIDRSALAIVAAVTELTHAVEDQTEKLTNRIDGTL